LSTTLEIRTKNDTTADYLQAQVNEQVLSHGLCQSQFRSL